MLIRQHTDPHPLVGFLKDKIRGDGQSKDTISRDALTKVRDQLAQSGAPTTRIDAILANYDTIDLNGDGVSRQEFATYKRNGLQDESAGKKFTKEELVALRDRLESSSGEPNAGLDAVIKHFEAADTNGDGSVSMSEMRAYAKSQGLSLTAKNAAGDDSGQTPEQQKEERAKEALKLIQSESLSDPLLSSDADSPSGSSAADAVGALSNG